MRRIIYYSALAMAAVLLLLSCGSNKEKPDVAVSSVKLSPVTLTLKEGESSTLTATVEPSDATEKTITWISSDDAVAKVSNGKVTGVKAGKATITAACGGKSATSKITVEKKAVAVSDVTLDQASMTLVEGESATLTATVKPDDATDKSVTWSSSDEAIAKVDQNGKVSALKPGSAAITAKAGEKSATCKITVEKKVIAVTSVSLDKTELTLTEGESATLTATVKPDDATDKSVTWSSSDESIAKMDQNGKVSALKPGSATITAKAGEKSATCKVTVEKKYIDVASVSLNESSITLKQNETFQLSATVLPEDATNPAVIWSSSDSSIATVDNGLVKALKEGTATITAKADGKSATCKVAVSNAASGGHEGTSDESWD